MVSRRPTLIVVCFTLGTLGLVDTATSFAVPSAEAQTGAAPCTKKHKADLLERYELNARAEKRTNEQQAQLSATLDAFDGLSVGGGGPIVMAKSWLLAPPVSRDLEIIVNQLASILRRDLPKIERVVIVDKSGRVTAPVAIVTLSDATVLTAGLKSNSRSLDRLAVALAELSTRSTKARAAVERKLRDLRLTAAQQHNDVVSLIRQLKHCNTARCPEVQRLLLAAVSSGRNELQVPSLCPPSTVPTGTTSVVPSSVPASVVAPSSVVPSGLVLESFRPAVGVLWSVSGDGKSASFTGPNGTQVSEFPAPAVVPAGGVTFVWTLTATAAVGNLATECEVKGNGFVATATPGLHAAAFSPAPGETNVLKVSVTLKPASLTPGSTAELYVGCFSNFGVHFLYKVK